MILLVLSAYVIYIEFSMLGDLAGAVGICDLHRVFDVG